MFRLVPCMYNDYGHIQAKYPLKLRGESLFYLYWGPVHVIRILVYLSSSERNILRRDCTVHHHAVT